MSTRILLSLAQCLLFLASCGSSTEPATRPNIVLISVDCLRADHLSCYGYERPTTPHLDALAASGVRFERTLASSSWTLPSHLSMLTGLPVSAHGIDDDRLYTLSDSTGTPLPVPLRGLFVSEVLQANGYRTGGFFTWKYLEGTFGFGPGFDTWERLGHTFYSHPEIGPAWEAVRKSNDVPGMKALAAQYPDLFDPARPSAPETVDRALAWLDESDPAVSQSADGGRPFFLFVHLFDAHDPYHPPEPHYSMFAGDYQGSIDGYNITNADSAVRHDMDPADLERLVSLYDGAIHFVDEQIGRLLDGLDQRGLGKDSLVIVTADHGEEFFEHGHKTHRRQLYMESIHVPLILSWPGELPPKTVVSGTSGLIDIAPTVLAAAGLASPVENAGRNLLPFARGEQNNGDYPYLAELTLFDGEPAPQRHAAIVEGHQQWLLQARGSEPWHVSLLDLGQDPLGRGYGEAMTLDAPPSPTSPSPLQRLNRQRDLLTRLRSLQPWRGEGAQALSTHDLEELAAMGYGGNSPRDAAPQDESDTAGDRLPLDGGVWSDG